MFHFELEGHPHAGVFLAWATRIFLLVSLILVSSYFKLQCFNIKGSKRLILINRRLEIWNLEFVKPCGEYLTMPSLNFAYLVFAKQMVKVKRSFLSIRFGETKIGLNVNLFHVIGPTSSSVSTVLFTPWPIGIVNITMSLKLIKHTISSRTVRVFYITSFLARLRMNSSWYQQPKVIFCWAILYCGILYLIALQQTFWYFLNEKRP